jgi:hypothetical protein
LFTSSLVRLPFIPLHCHSHECFSVCIHKESVSQFNPIARFLAYRDAAGRWRAATATAQYSIWFLQRFLSLNIVFQCKFSLFMFELESSAYCSRCQSGGSARDVKFSHFQLKFFLDFSKKNCSWISRIFVFLNVIFRFLTYFKNLNFKTFKNSHKSFELN